MSDIKWTNVDVGTLTASDRVLFDRLKATQAAYAQAKAELTETLRKSSGEPRLIFGFAYARHDKISVAIGDPRTTAKPKLSLSAFLASADQSGRQR